MDEDLSTYSRADRSRIARTAKRKVGSEATLILTAGFGVTMVALFFGARFSFLPLAEAIGIRPTIVWVALSSAIAATWAWLHVSLLTPKVSRARELDAAFLYEQQRLVRKDRARKISELSDTP